MATLRRRAQSYFVQPSSGKGIFIGNTPTPTITTTSSTTSRPPHTPLQPSPAATHHRMNPPSSSAQEGNGPGGGGGGWRGGGGGGGPNGSDSYLQPGGLPYSPREDVFYPDFRPDPSGGGGDSDSLSATASSMLAEDFWSANGTLSSSFDGCDEEQNPFCSFSLDGNGTDFANGSVTGNGTLSEVLENKYWTIVLIIFPMFTVFGNVLVVMSVVREKSLKTVTNYFICSLAVADIMVAVVVMPFAVYVEVAGGWWLSDLLCDAWVAADVMACTASILNLTAISVDRFIAVTQPIKYAKHKNSKRVYIMIAITWIISVAIAMPISIGVNYSPDRRAGDCSFFNADFIIYSSMGSFYIPSIIMIFLYWKIYRVIRQRAQKAKAAKKKAVDSRALQSVIENTGATAAAGFGGGAGGGGGTTSDGGNGEVVNSTQIGGGGGGGGGTTTTALHSTASEPTVTTGLAKMDNGRVTSYNTTGIAHHHHHHHQHHHHQLPHRQLLPPVVDDTSVSNVPSGSDSHNDDDDDEDDSNANIRIPPPTPDHATQLLARSPHHHTGEDGELGAQLIANPGAAAAELREGSGKATTTTGSAGSGDSNEGASNDGCSNQAETPFTSPGGSGRKKHGKSKNSCSPTSRQKKGVTKFNFHMRTSRKRKEKSSSRKEKKATKTLAIVLGGFLLCWAPFFTINIINAICIRYQVKDTPACNLDKMLFAFFIWLGYINSFLNPVIYTIFNPEFRKAFKRILTEPCCKGGRR